MRRGITGLIVASTALALLGLAGCAPEPTAPTSSTPTPRAAATPTPTPTPTPTVFLGTGVALRYSCDVLVDPTVIESLDKNLRENPSYQPAATTSAERAVAIRGTACQWKDPTTGSSLVVTAAHPDPPTLADLTSTTASYAKPTTLFGTDVSGFIVNTQIEIFTRSGYWATATSPLFSDVTVARSVMAAIEQSLPGG
jgi:hypothetical protein